MFNKLRKRSPKNVEPIQTSRHNADADADNSTFIDGFGNSTVENEKNNFYSKTSMSNPNFEPRNKDHFEIEESKTNIDVKEGKWDLLTSSVYSTFQANFNQLSFWDHC